MLTARELCGVALFASLFFGAGNVVYRTTGLRPWVAVPGQSERASAALSVLPFYLALSVMAGSGTTWTFALATNERQGTAAPVVTGLVLGVAVAALFARRARTVVPRNAVRVAARRAARANRGVET